MVKKMFLLSLVVFVSLSFTGCMSVVTPVWNPLQFEQKVTYEKVWPAILSAVTESYEIEMVDKDSGFLRTTWKVTKDMLGQQQSRTRISIRIVSKEPLNLQIQAQLQKFESLTNEWMDQGNDQEIENSLKALISARFAYKK
jgi:hypothetical protein